MVWTVKKNPCPCDGGGVLSYHYILSSSLSISIAINELKREIKLKQYNWKQAASRIRLTWFKDRAHTDITVHQLLIA